MTETNPPKKIPLDAFHRKQGAKMVPFAGYEMPLQYKAGILEEHLHTREGASLFDVSHMGQAFIRGKNPHAALETLVPADIEKLAGGKIRYSLLTNERGGIIDDLMITHCGDHLYIVVNAARKDADFAYIEDAIGDKVELEILEDRALLSLQGPASAEVLAGLVPATRHLMFMTSGNFQINAIPSIISRSGYSGEDGYEISIPAKDADQVAHLLLGAKQVNLAGLGARDSLRLEAGLCLYGNDIDESTTPVEADLVWAIDQRRREEGGYPGASIINDQIANNPDRKRVGLLPEGHDLARAHTEITSTDGTHIGEVTSGGFGPTVDGPIAMGYVNIAHAEPGTEVRLVVGEKSIPAKVTKLPFIKRNYFEV